MAYLTAVSTGNARAGSTYARPVGFHGCGVSWRRTGEPCQIFDRVLCMLTSVERCGYFCFSLAGSERSASDEDAAGGGSRAGSPPTHGSSISSGSGGGGDGGPRRSRQDPKLPRHTAWTIAHVAMGNARNQNELRRLGCVPALVGMLGESERVPSMPLQYWLFTPESR
jgi:hypothetical protein